MSPWLSKKRYVPLDRSGPRLFQTAAAQQRRRPSTADWLWPTVEGHRASSGRSLGTPAARSLMPWLLSHGYSNSRFPKPEGFFSTACYYAMTQPGLLRHSSIVHIVTGLRSIVGSRHSWCPRLDRATKAASGTHIDRRPQTRPRHTARLRPLPEPGSVEQKPYVGAVAVPVCSPASN
jgi:hypothetical protein